MRFDFYHGPYDSKEMVKDMSPSHCNVHPNCKYEQNPPLVLLLFLYLFDLEASLLFAEYLGVILRCTRTGRMVYETLFALHVNQKEYWNKIILFNNFIAFI